MEKLAALLTFVVTVIALNLLANYAIPVFNWICNNISMWTPQVGYLPWVLLISVGILYLYTMTWAKSPD